MNSDKKTPNGAASKPKPKRRTLNVKFLAGVIVATVFLAGGVHFLHGAQVKRNVVALKNRADLALREEKLDEAVTYLNRYLSFKPDDQESLTNLGFTLDKLAKTPRQRAQVFLIFDRVLRMDPTRSDIRRRVVASAMEIGRFADAIDHLQVLLQETPEAPDLEQQLADCFDNNTQYAEAERMYRKVIGHAPEQIECYERLAVLLRKRLNQPKEVADHLMDKLVSQNQRAFRAYLARARYRREFDFLENKDRLATLADDVKQARELAPDDADVLYAAADLAMIQASLSVGNLESAYRRVAEGRETLRHALELYPQDPRFYRLLAGLEQRWGTTEDSLDTLRRGLEAIPGQEELLWTSTDMLIEKGDLAHAREQIATLRQMGTVFPALIQYLEARVLVREDAPDKWRRAATTLEQIRPTLTMRSQELARRTDLLLAECYAALLDFDKQLGSCRRAVEQDPLWVPGRLALAACLAAQGKVDESLAEYRRVLPFGNVPLIVARLLLVRNLKLPGPERDWREFDSVLELAAKAFPDSPAVSLVRSQALAARKSAAAARDELVKARDKNPDNPQLWIALATLAGQQGEFDEAFRLLDDAQKQIGDTVELRLARALVVVQKRGDRASSALLSLETGLDDFDTAKQAALLLGLANAQFQLGNLAETLRLLGQVTDRRPGDLRIYVTMFDLAAQLGDEAAQERIMGALRQIEGPAGPLVCYVEVSRNLSSALRGDKESLRQARSWLAKAAAARPAWAPLARLSAEICDLEGDHRRAVEEFQRAVALGEMNPRTVSRLLQLLYSQQRFAEADQLIRKLQTQNSLPADSALLASTISIQLNDMERAIEYARQAVASQRENYQHHGFLALLLSRFAEQAESGAKSDQYMREAEQEFREALQRMDQIPDTWLALVGFLARRGRTDEAEAVIEQAKEKLPAEVAPLALAQCYELLGRRKLSEQYYLKVLQADPNNVAALCSSVSFYMRHGQLQQAESYINKILEPERRAPGSESAWARRALANIKLAQGDFKRALELVDQNLSVRAGSPDDLRFKATLLGSQESRRKRLEAIAILEGLSDRGVTSPSDQYLLAKLYEKESNWPKSRTLMLTLVGANGSNKIFVFDLAWALCRHKELQDAQTWVDRLEQLAPDSFMAASAKARLLSAQEKGNEAAAQLRAYLNRQNAAPVPDTLRTVCELAASQKTDEAIELLSTYVDDEQDRLVAETLRKARLLVSDGKAAAVAELLKTELSGQSFLESRLAETARLAAELLSEQGEHRHAEEFVRQYASLVRRPEATLLVARNLVRQGRVKDALAVCEQARTNCPPELVAPVTIAVIRYGKAEEADVRPFDTWLRELVGKKPRAIPLLLALADLHDARERYNEAEQVYRQILQIEPNNVVALNNLGWLLSQRSAAKESANALVLINRAIELAGSVPELLDTRGTIYLALGQVDRALADLEDAVDRTPPGSTAMASKLFHLAKAYEMARKKEAAKTAMNRARECGIAEPGVVHRLEEEDYRGLLARYTAPLPQ